MSILTDRLVISIGSFHCLGASIQTIRIVLNACSVSHHALHAESWSAHSTSRLQILTKRVISHSLPCPILSF